MKKVWLSLFIGTSILIQTHGRAFSQEDQSSDQIIIPTDTLFDEPYIDMDEWREEPVRHRYVHGGFKGTDTRFSFYFPPKEQYEGRFFQYITPFARIQNLGRVRVVVQ